MKNITKLISLLTLTTALSACTIPGGNIEGVSADNNGLTEQEQFDITQSVNTVLITPRVLKQLKLSEPTATQNSVLQNKLNKYAYKVGIGDVLTVVVYDHPELTLPMGEGSGGTGNLIDAEGNIFFPFIGPVYVSGKSIKEIRQDITGRIKRYIENPQIDVKVAKYNSKRTYVTGAVNSPTVVPIANVPVTLLDAINGAGGIKDGADWRSVILTRDSQDERLDLYALYQKGDMSQNRLLQHNDIVHVPRNDANKVFVMGEVKRARTLPIQRSGLTLAEALGNVGGFNEMTADASGIFVLRASKQANMTADVYQLDASNAAALILATQFTLQPMDLVYVTSVPIARWNKVISLLLPTVRGLDALNDLNDAL